MSAVVFGRPELLLGLVLVPLAVWLALADRRRAATRRRWSAVSRALLLTVLVLALTEPRVVRPVDATSVAFLLDRSDSVPAAQKARADAFAAEAVAAMDPEDRAAVVAFGERALVDRTARRDPLGPVRSRPGGGWSDIGAALRLGLAVLPADTNRRLVLASDGRANRGALERQVRLAAAQGVAVDVVPLPAAVGAEEVLVTTLEAPTSTRVGQRFDLTAVVRAEVATTAQLEITSEGQLIRDERVRLAPGDRRFTVPVTVESPGFHRYQVRIVPARDGRSENNRAAAFTVTAGPPRVLVLSATPARAAALVNALEAGDRRPDLRSPDAAPNSLLELADYDAVVLVDTPAGALSPALIDALVAFERDLGRGLVMVGGEDGFGAGGYRHTALERALPVDMEVRDRMRRPDIALAFVVDKSGSMAGCDPCPQGIGPSKVDLAKEAVLQAAELLEPRDRAALVTFDGEAHRPWPLQRHEAPGDFAAAVAGVQAGGGTNIAAGLEAAVRTVRDADVPLKHIILLTDGQSSATGYQPLLAEIDAGGVTLSIVGVGADRAPYLPGLAEQGGGRFYPVDDPADIPQVFVEETMAALGSYIIEERFRPVPGTRSEVLTGLDPTRLPPLNGYNGTTAKMSARVALWTPREDPLLAHWQYGLGRSVAWTSDLKRQWASDWLDRDVFSQLVVQMVDWTLPPAEDEDLHLSTTVEGGHATLALDVEGLRSDDALLAVEARLSAPDGTAIDVPLLPTGPSRYVGAVDLPGQGSYAGRIDVRRGDELVGVRTLGLIVPYSPEYADPSAEPVDPRLSWLAAQTGGQVLKRPAAAFRPARGVTRADDIWPWLLLAAALLLPLDVAARRLRLGRRDLEVARRWLRDRLPQRSPRPRPAPGERALGGLFAARDRARERLQTGELTPAEPDAEADAETTAEPAATVSEDESENEIEGPIERDAADTLSRLRRAKERARRE